MSMMGLTKKLDWAVSSIQVYFGFLELFNFAKLIKRLEALDMWLCRRIERISWTETVTSETVLYSRRQ